MLKNLEKYKVILASNSPRRKELLSGLGICYEVKTLPGIEESYPDTLSGEEIPVFIACEKADAYRQTMHSDELIITADTIVWLDGLVMGCQAYASLPFRENSSSDNRSVSYHNRISEKLCYCY